MLQSRRQVKVLSNTALNDAPLNNINSTYLNIKPQLPVANDLASYSPTQILNVLNLATTFCAGVIGNNTTRANVLNADVITAIGSNTNPTTFFGNATNRTNFAA